MKKTFLTVALAIMLGVGTGAGIAALQIAIAPWDGDPEGVRLRGSAVARSGGPLPRVVVDREEFEFGTMDVKAEAKHSFILTNRGGGTLELTAGETSCGCTLSEIEDGRIAPGESGTVTVKWTAEKGEGPYTQTATIETNDPDRPRVILTVSGVITRVVRPVPTELVFGHVSAGRPVTGQVRLLCYLDEPLEVMSCEMVGEQTRDYFEVRFEPLTANQLNETHQEQGKTGGEGGLGGEAKPGEAKPGEAESPKSGYLLRVTVKPGLLLGVFHQTIKVRTNLRSIPMVEIPVAGTVVGDISIVGPGWDSKNGVLALGTISGREGIQRRLLLVTRGPHSREIQFTLLKTNPDLLEVDEEELKKTSKIASGSATPVTQTPLIIRIPKGSRPANYLGTEFGEILINTSHPDIPQLRIRVRFAVEG